MAIGARINQTKYEVFRWRYELSLTKKLVLALGVAGVIGLLAQVRFPLPWSPVPITGQTLAVLLAGVLLGRWWGGISVAMYAGLGAAGVPWFNGMTSGLGATWGYILGFILAALFLGYFTDRYLKSRRFITVLGLMLIASLVIVYVPGLIWLKMWLGASGNSVDLATLLGMGAVPFIAGDVTKSLIAAGIASAVLPRMAYGPEVVR